MYPNIINLHFYTFGSLKNGRNFSVGSGYRFGFNGMEKSNEVSGEGNSYTTEYRQLDVRLGRWFSVDPLAFQSSSTSPYCAFDNNPIYFTDPRGLASEPPKTHTVKKGDWLSKIAKNNGTTVDVLMSLNKDIKDKDKIEVGQKIILPSSLPKSSNPNQPNKPMPEEHGSIIQTFLEKLDEVEKITSAVEFINATPLYVVGGKIKRISDLKSFSKFGGEARLGLIKEFPKFNGNTNTFLKFRGFTGEVLGKFGTVATGLDIAGDGIVLIKKAVEGNLKSTDVTLYLLESSLKGVCLYAGPAGWLVLGIYELSDHEYPKNHPTALVKDLKSKNGKDNTRIVN